MINLGNKIERTHQKKKSTKRQRKVRENIEKEKFFFVKRIKVYFIYKKKVWN